MESCYTSKAVAEVPACKLSQLDGLLRRASELSLLEEEEEQLNNIEEEFPFEVVLDSGAADHVTDNTDAPGYAIEPSDGSKAGKGFIAANGARIPNRGQMTLSLKTE